MNGDDFLTKSISGFSRVLESVVTTEDISRASGLLQSLDSRVKLVSFLLFHRRHKFGAQPARPRRDICADNTFEFNIKNISRFLPETGPDFCAGFYVGNRGSGAIPDTRAAAGAHLR